MWRMLFSTSCLYKTTGYKNRVCAPALYKKSSGLHDQGYTGMQDPFYYRNKAQFPIQVINDTVYMGFYRPHSNSIVDCDSCVIQSKEINEV